MTLEDEQQSKAIKASDFSSLESFPTEIIVDILSRLPVKSLLRCKSVCKSWLSLISDPYFVKYHLTLSTTNRHYRHLLVSRDVRVENLKTCPLYDVMYDHNSINPLELDYPMKHSRNSVSIVGSCNGLMLIAIERKNLFIWNPSTRKSIQLPHPPRYDGFMIHGFGYNVSSDDYNVVEITGSFVGTFFNRVMIYSSKNGNWKEIDSFPHPIWFNDSNAFLKGALHWIATKVDGSWTIVSLDLAKETYGEVMPPVDREDDIDLKLGILGDYLCVLCDYSRHSSFYCGDVWVMKVYGVKHSWFKLVSIPYHLEGRFLRYDWDEQYYVEASFLQFDWNEQFLAPLCVSDDGKVLVQIGWRLIMFDSKKGSASEIQKLNELNEACTFVESLVSPGGHGNLI